MSSAFASWKFAYLVNKLTPAGTMVIDRDIGVTNGRLYLVNDNQVEWISFTGISWSGSSWTLSGVTRDINPVLIPATSDSTGKTWLANQKCLLVAMHDQLQDFSLSVNLPNYADATARDSAITSPINGMMIYNSGTGTIQQYIGGSWSDLATGTVVNASTTVAGKVEIATQAEVNAWTWTWGTWAILAVSPDTLKVKMDASFAWDTRSNTTLTATSPSDSTTTYYSSWVQMTRWGGVTISVSSSSWVSAPWYAGIETSVDWSTWWTDSGYSVTATNATSTPIFVPVKWWVYVRVKFYTSASVSHWTATWVLFY